MALECESVRRVAGALGVLFIAGCGQNGSSLSYESERTADGGCIVTVHSGREQIDTGSIFVTEDCRLEAWAGGLALVPLASGAPLGGDVR